jgi:hypothetical protein
MERYGGKVMEIIKRKIQLEKIQLEYQHFQVSYNDWGYLMLRWFNDNDENKTEDFVIVLTHDETRRVVAFIRNVLRGD